MDPFNVAGDSACAISSFLINQYAYSVTIIIIIYIRIKLVLILYTYYSKYKLYSTHNHIGQQYVHLHYSKHISPCISTSYKMFMVWTDMLHF